MKAFIPLALLFALLVVAGCASEQTAPSPSPQVVPPSPQADRAPPSAAPPSSATPPPTATPSSSSDSAVREFTMTAKKWEFNPATIIVNAGETVRLSITSLDVAHGFSLPDFNVNSRIEPGQATVVEFVADTPGTYTFFCSVYCGSGHSSMKGTLVVQ
ncbi:cupredoxin domain-containing protein [Candidatus Woesearchaeota archaeon]|nr:cupredoxin domain-containing protein [Candidatus Woesearchaeota archaeon]